MSELFSDRWKLRTDFKNGQHQLIAEPEPEAMLNYISESTKKLSQILLESEEKMILEASPTWVLRRMKKIIEDEMKLRGAE